MKTNTRIICLAVVVGFFIAICQAAFAETIKDQIMTNKPQVMPGMSVKQAITLGKAKESIIEVKQSIEKDSPTVFERPKLYNAPSITVGSSIISTASLSATINNINLPISSVEVVATPRGTPIHYSSATVVIGTALSYPQPQTIGNNEKEPPISIIKPLPIGEPLRKDLIDLGQTSGTIVINNGNKPDFSKFTPIPEKEIRAGSRDNLRYGASFRCSIETVAIDEDADTTTITKVGNPDALKPPTPPTPATGRISPIASPAVSSARPIELRGPGNAPHGNHLFSGASFLYSTHTIEETAGSEDEVLLYSR